MSQRTSCARAVGRCDAAGVCGSRGPTYAGPGPRILGTDWYGLDTPRHLTIFSEAGLGAALRAAGFARLEWRPSVGLGEAGQRARRVVRHRRRVARGRRDSPRMDPEANPASVTVPVR